MSETPTIAPSSMRRILSARIGPVRVVWIIAALIVGVLVYLAYQSRGTVASDPSVDTASEVDLSDGETVSDGNAIMLAGATSTGGFIANPAPVYDVETAPTTTVETNDTWGSKAVTYLISKGYSGGEAQVAISKYLNGDQLSYEQGQMRDAAIAQFGIPPEPMTAGDTLSAPAIKQGNPPTKHIIKGSSDNTAAELAVIYYGASTAETTMIIRSQNPDLLGAGPWPVGSTVNIPLYAQPVYYYPRKGVSDESAAKIARINGTSEYAIRTLNPKLKFPVKNGTRVRVK